MILVLTLLPSNRNVQINCQLVSSLAMMAYVTWVRPYESKTQTNTEIINEITVLLSSYHLFCFTEWVYDMNRRLEIGWSLVGFIIFNILINLAIFLATIFKNFKKSVKRRYAAKNRSFRLKKQEESHYQLNPIIFDKEDDLEANGNKGELPP